MHICFKSLLLTASCSLLLIPTMANAASLPAVDYDHIYDPTTGQAPSAVATPWALTGSDPLASISGEIATVTTNNSPDSGVWGRYGADGVDLDATGYTLDFRADPTADPSGFFLSIAVNDPDDTGSLFEIRLGESAGNHFIAIQEEGGGTRAQGNVALDDGMHTYRFTRLGNNFSVYVDAVLAPVLTGTIANNFSGSVEGIRFGDLGGSIVGSGSLDWIAVEQDVAIFAPPVSEIPEPASLGMLLVASGLILRSRR